MTPTLVLHAENVSSSASRLAVNLLTSLFTPEELGSGNCTKPNRSDIVLLDQKKIQAIRGSLIGNNITNVLMFLAAHVNYKFPVDEGTEMKRWKEILTNNLNSKCRSCRPRSSH